MNTPRQQMLGAKNMNGNLVTFSLATCFLTAWMQKLEKRKNSYRDGAKESRQFYRLGW